MSCEVRCTLTATEQYPLVAQVCTSVQHMGNQPFSMTPLFQGVLLSKSAHKESPLLAASGTSKEGYMPVKQNHRGPCTLTRPPHKTANLWEKKKKPSSIISYEIMNFLIILFSNCYFFMVSDNHREPFSSQDTQTTGF